MRASRRSARAGSGAEPPREQEDPALPAEQARLVVVPELEHAQGLGGEVDARLGEAAATKDVEREDRTGGAAEEIELVGGRFAAVRDLGDCVADALLVPRCVGERLEGFRLVEHQRARARSQTCVQNGASTR